MRRTSHRLCGIVPALFASAAVAAAFAVSGCGEDAKVHALPPGDGTLESPYLIQTDKNYTEIPVDEGGTVFIVAEGVGADWYGLTTASSADIDLVIAGFSDFMGAPAQLVESATPNDGNEHLEALGDGTHSNLFFTVDGTHVRGRHETFDVTIAPNSAPGGVTIMLDPCAVTAPSAACGDTMSGDFAGDLEFPFALAPKAKLSVTLTNTSGDWVFMRARSNGQDSGGYVDFPANDFVYGDGYCHVNSGPPGATPVTTGSETCKINPIPDNPAPAGLRLVNNTMKSDVPVTVKFRTP